MKKLLTIVFAMLLGATLSFSQAAGGSGGQEGGKKTPATESGKKSTKGGKKGHKGGKKGKKGAGGTTTPAPK
jgi:hypothetical protein